MAALGRQWACRTCVAPGLETALWEASPQPDGSSATRTMPETAGLEASVNGGHQAEVSLAANFPQPDFWHAKLPVARASAIHL